MIEQAKARAAAAWRWLWCEAPESIKGYVHPDELVRCVAASVATGSTFFGVLEAIAHDRDLWLDKQDFALVSAAITFGLTLWRRFHHGSS